MNQLAMRSLVIGFGEIGKAVKAVTEAEFTMDKTYTIVPTGVDVMHICFPYSETFVEDVRAYMQQFEPLHVIVYSTVPIGTCEKIGDFVAHSPVEGKHPDLELSIRTMERWVGCDDEKELMFYRSFFGEMYMKVRAVPSSRFTEALKLLSTTEYGVNIAFAKYKADIADVLEMPYELMQEWNREYNRLYKELGMEKRFQKYVLDKPSGPIGGHCVVPNVELLGLDFPSPFLKIIKEVQ